MGSVRDLFLGLAGQRVVMAEFLRRGFNVAVPEVDIGDDFLVIDERRGTFSRVQVKTSSTEALKTSPGFRAQFWIPTRQLLTPKKPELFYVLAARGGAEADRRSRMEDGGWRGGIAARKAVRGLGGGGWEFLVISRRTLKREHASNGFGSLANERVLIGVTFRRTSVRGHGRDLQGYRNNWERYWREA